MPNIAIRLDDVKFAYAAATPVLHFATLEIGRTESTFLYGPSGSGKTTLLGLLGGILAPQVGKIEVLGENLGEMTASERDAFRGRHVGFIFQMFNLIPYLSVGENIMLPARLREKSSSTVRRSSHAEIEAQARALAERLGIGAKFTSPATDLSVGQQQRVAAARALVGSPEIVIADEPTSALDTDHREAFITLLFEVCAAAKATLVFVSHDHSLKRLFTRSLSLPDLNAGVLS